MAAFQESVDFCSLDQLPKDLYWINKPPKFELVRSHGNGSRTGGLHISPAAKKDFWQRTFYTPLLVKADGPALLRKIPDGLNEWRAEVRFSLENATNQFDQAGLMIYVDEQRWLKAGVEVVDGVPRMSCVVTNVYSDWSVQPWHTTYDVAIRVSHVRGSVAVEYRGSDERWHFYRIAPSMMTDQQPAGVGMVCCSPTEAGMTAILHSFTFSNKVSVDHHS